MKSYRSGIDVLAGFEASDFLSMIPIVGPMLKKDQPAGPSAPGAYITPAQQQQQAQLQYAQAQQAQIALAQQEAARKAESDRFWKTLVAGVVLAGTGLAAWKVFLSTKHPPAPAQASGGSQ